MMREIIFVCGKGQVFLSPFEGTLWYYTPERYDFIHFYRPCRELCVWEKAGGDIHAEEGDDCFFSQRAERLFIT